MPVVQSVKRWDTPASGVWHAASCKVKKVAISTFQGKNALMVEDCLRLLTKILRVFFSVFATFFLGASGARGRFRKRIEGHSARSGL